MQALDLDFPLLSDWNADATHGFGVEYDGDGVVRGAWAYAIDELPDLDELLAAARAL
jgi:hypothetical protein